MKKMTSEEWLSSDTIAEKSKRPYAHFDYRTNVKQQAAYLSDPEKIAHHGFYPFIHYEQVEVKYNKKEGKKVKIRDICYAAHIDRCIYQYYSFLLNERYNERVAKDGIAQAAVAYRTELHQSNIHFAKRAIDFIHKKSSCYVMIGDFTGFFDHLDHKYLKRQWCSLLGEPQLPSDHYNIFKNTTRYATWELSDILAINNKKLKEQNPNAHDLTPKELNSKARVLTPEEFKANRSHIKRNPNTFGIPQGSPISGLLANIYMLEVDKKVHEKVKKLNGFYMRYSDDFMIVIPDTGPGTRQELTNIVAMFDIDGLTLEPKKTQYFRFDSGNLENCGDLFGVPMENHKRFINFLGFTFDGKTVSVRTRTIGRYYRRMYKKARTIVEQRQRNPKKYISERNLYTLYSAKGDPIRQKNKKAVLRSGNFLSYVRRSKKIFKKQDEIQVLIDRDTRRHMLKMRKALKGKK